ncbi:MAG: phosphoribosylformylglycinamidine cyclo-ligase [Nanoarchaeota archaeon]|nr:phosphoribosylformylglycinamidine cyclo-ligase [Nanoarchaeota archaeon]
MITYKESGVDIDFGNSIVDDLKNDHYPSWVIDGIGGFNSIINLDSDEIESVVNRPFSLVTSTDGVGTKLLLSIEYGKLENIGIDLVAMSINDIICSGAIPLGFLDYISYSKLDKNQLLKILSGIKKGCQISNCQLVGGETAQMPDVYKNGHFDLAGFAFGLVPNNKYSIGKQFVESGDVLIGIQSNGLHSNGYSLIRKILKEKQCINVPIDELMKPTKIYSSIVNKMLSLFPADIHGIAHITGGGLYENIKRIIKSDQDLKIIKNAWKKPNIYNWLESLNLISEEELYKTFNMGIGMVFIVKKSISHSFQSVFLNEFSTPCYIIGEVI